MQKIGCKVIVSGKVQGVCFRYYTSQEAGKLGLTGHAKNLYDGNVEVVLYGNYAAIHKMLKWLEKGPSTAIVDNLEVSDIPYSETNGFPTY